MRTFLLTMIGMLALQIGVVKAQNVVSVNPGFNTLNQAVATALENGNEAMANTIFELERGGTYLLNGSLQNTGYTLNIRAAEGDGDRPKLVPAVASGGESERPFRPRGDLNLTGLHITNRDELGKVNSRMIRCSADDITVRINDCVFDTDNQAMIRLDNDRISIFMENCIVGNIGLPADPTNGRGIDDRGNDIDSLVIENCTFFNITSRVLRDDGGVLNYSRINHNHFVNIGQRLVSLGEVIEAEFTNNMVVDAGFLGTTSGLDYHLIEMDSLQQDLIDAGHTQKINLKNNNFFLHSALNDLYADTITATPLYNGPAQAFAEEQDAASTNLSEEVSFTNGPAVPTYILDNFWSDPANTEEWDRTGAPYNFGYANTLTSYSHATDSKPLGDLRWFDITTGVEDLLLGTNTLEINAYPNPSNGKVSIRFSLEEEKNIELTVVNTTGQVVKHVANSAITAGNNLLELDLSGSPAGVYYCRVKAGDKTGVKQLVVRN